MLYHTLSSSLRANIINRTYSKGLSEPSKSFPTFEAQGSFRTQRYPPPLTSTSVPPSYRHSNPRQSTSPKRGQPFRPPFEVVSPFRTSFELPLNFEVTSKLEFHFELLRISSNHFDTPFSNPFNLSTIHPSTLLLPSLSTTSPSSVEPRFEVRGHRRTSNSRFETPLSSLPLTRY